MSRPRQSTHSPSTQRVYASKFRQFARWCATTGRTALPIRGVDVVDWLRALVDAGTSRSTLGTALRGVDCMAERARCPPPSAAESVRTELPRLRAAARRRERRDKTRTRRLTLHFTDREFECVTARAREARVSPRRWLREQLLRAG